MKSNYRYCKNLEVYATAFFYLPIFRGDDIQLAYLFSNYLSNTVEVFIVTKYFRVNGNLILRSMLIGGGNI